MYENHIQYPGINAYLRDQLADLPGDIGELEQALRPEGLPIVKPETARLLWTLCSLKQPARILEIGTCVGFSALLFARACPTAAITTIDRYDYMIERARENFKQYDRAGQITQLEGQASDFLPQLSEQYDFIFLDAAKGQYPLFFPHCLRLLREGGLFVADNVLFNGLVADSTGVTRRDQTIVRRLRTFIQLLGETPELSSCVLPVGDGLAVALKQQKRAEEVPPDYNSL